MIDLRNTYCHKYSPHFTEYCALIREQGLVWCNGYNFGDFAFSLDFIHISKSNKVSQSAHSFKDSYREFKGTKPMKTKTTYEKVTMRDYEALQEFHAGKEFYHNMGFARDYREVKSVISLVSAHSERKLYTKTETPLAWRDAVVDYIEKCDMYHHDIKSENEDATFILNSCDLSDKQFLKMCHDIAEITERPE
ncbi:hypothetical protein [Vibrio casei]|uniref:hypothetical protein n=1 Tax=Vibrio casei TaxID=673372 RepID=UPI003F967CDD